MQNIRAGRGRVVSSKYLVTPRPRRDVGFGRMFHSLPKLCGSDGVETCCLIIEGRETHHSLARDFHAAAFALRLVVSAFTNREGDLSRRKCVAASDQNFVRFVTPQHVRVNARGTETVARRRRCARRDTACASSGSVRSSRGILNAISFGPPFPVRQAFSNTNARRTNRNTSTGAIPKIN